MIVRCNFQQDVNRHLVVFDINSGLSQKLVNIFWWSTVNTETTFGQNVNLMEQVQDIARNMIVTCDNSEAVFSR